MSLTRFQNRGPEVGQWFVCWQFIRNTGGQGIGHALMEECISRCRQAKIAAIGLHTTKAIDIARKMYERMGFTRVPESDFHPVPSVTVMAYSLQL